MASLVAVGQSNVVAALQQWRTVMNQFLSSPKSIATPLNVTATGIAGAINVSWAAVKDASGYEVHISKDGSFLDTVIIPLSSGDTTNYSDVVGANPAVRFYKVRATAGSAIDPTAVKSKFSQEVTTTSLVFNQVNFVVITGGSTTNTALVDMGLSTTLVVKGNANATTLPTVMVVFSASIQVISGATVAASVNFQILRDGTQVGNNLTVGFNTGSASIIVTFPASLTVIDVPPSLGSHVYSVSWQVSTTTTANVATSTSANLTAIQLV